MTQSTLDRPGRRRLGLNRESADVGAVRGHAIRLATWVSRNRPVTVLGIVAASYVVLFGMLTWRHHTNFGTAAFDMGIYDQGLWLLSRFRRPFLTVRGMNYFGHHANYATVALVPAYWLGAGPRFLYLVETVVLALGVVPLWLLARARIQSEWLAVCVGGAYLLHPAVEWINWWHFHPDALLTTPLLFAYWFATQQRWRWFTVCAVLVALVKEDGALAIAAFGLLLLVRRRWRPGVATLAAGAAWFLAATRVLIPRANNGLHALYDELFPAYGSSVVEIVGTIVRHPSRVFRDLAEHSNLFYAWQLFAPVALAPALALPVLLIALPQLTINGLSLHQHTRDIHYHYSAIPVAVLFLATVEAVGRLRTPVLRRAAIGLVVVSSVVGHVFWAPSPLGREFRSGVWAGPGDRAVSSMRYAVNLVPNDAGVAASASLVPHLTHRTHIYEWPHPFVALEGHWGVLGSAPPDPTSVDYVAVDFGDPFTHDMYPDGSALFVQLTGPGGGFELVFQGENVYVARRRG